MPAGQDRLMFNNPMPSGTIDGARPIVSLFIPVYNVRRLIKVNLRKSYNALLKLDSNFEIFIVDDNSSDKSDRFARIINRARSTAGRDVRYIRYNNGPSRRENLTRSFYLARGEIICFIDADFSCDISYLLKAIEFLKEKPIDIVIGSRYIKGVKIKRRFVRRFFSFFYNLAIRVLFKSKIKDHQCGLKAFRKNAAMPIIDKMGYDNKFIRGWFWDAEFLIRAQRAKLKIMEMPVEWHEANVSTFDIRRELRCLKAIIALKRELK
jgi:glycosyltransferase involved in cell wall biosynthesis